MEIMFRNSVLIIVLFATITAARRADLDFEFDEATASGMEGARRAAESREHAGGACGRTWCGLRDVCVLRAGRAQCLSRQDLRPGDTLVASSTSEWAQDDDVFYDGGSPDDTTTTDANAARCVACERRSGTPVCGSNNRTYASLCKLDLRNCVRRGVGSPISVACRGACPCMEKRRVHVKTARMDTTRARRRRPSNTNTDSAGCAMGALADRLLDWFAVLMDEAGDTPPHALGFPRDCKPEVRWMFTHLDSDSNAKLTSRELYALRHDDRERCLRPFLASCSSSSGITRAAWCGCLRRAQRPCTALTRAHSKAPPGSYVPSCDSRGFYRPRQCHPALNVCWCVTAHGVELPGSKTKGSPSCTEELESNSISEDADGAPDDDEDADTDGSGQGPLSLD